MTLILLAACSFTKTRIHVHDHLTKSDAAVVVAGPVYAVDLDLGDSFKSNTTVGNVTFTGGYVTENTGAGLFNVSKHVAVDAEEIYRGHAGAWIEDLVDPTAEISPPLPSRHERRGTDPKDGHDNLSLPRVDLTPVALTVAPGRVTTVPIVMSYYTHNGGWFFGQEWGTGAGARVRIVLVTYAADGSVLGWMDIDGSRTSDRVFSPTGPQLQDLLIALEKRVGRKLQRAL